MAINDPSHPAFGSVGRPLPSVELQFLSDREIILRPKAPFLGYWNRAASSSEGPSDGWVHTGDLGYLDNEGRLHISDRKKDMMVVSGFNVYPNELENVISMCPGVLECAAVGVADERQGEAIKVYVVRSEIPAGTPTGDLGDRVAKEEIPRKVAASGAITNLKQIKGLVTGAVLVKGEQVVRARFTTPSAYQSTGNSVAVPTDLLTMYGADSQAHPLSVLIDRQRVRPVPPRYDEELALAVAALTRGYARTFETAEQLARAAAQLASAESAVIRRCVRRA